MMTCTTLARGIYWAHCLVNLVNEAGSAVDILWKEHPKCPSLDKARECLWYSHCACLERCVLLSNRPISSPKCIIRLSAGSKPASTKTSPMTVESLGHERWETANLMWSHVWFLLSFQIYGLAAPNPTLTIPQRILAPDVTLRHRNPVWNNSGRAPTWCAPTLSPNITRVCQPISLPDLGDSAKNAFWQLGKIRSGQNSTQTLGAATKLAANNTNVILRLVMSGCDSPDPQRWMQKLLLLVLLSSLSLLLSLLFFSFFFFFVFFSLSVDVVQAPWWGSNSDNLPNPRLTMTNEEDERMANDRLSPTGWLTDPTTPKTKLPQPRGRQGWWGRTGISKQGRGRGVHPSAPSPTLP